MTDLQNWSQSLVKVGDGRGFIVGPEHGRMVVTAAHCLPRLPEPRADPHLQLLGPLGGAATIWAEMLFVDPISDLAVLGVPDPQERAEQAEGYEELTSAAPALPICAGMFTPSTGPVSEPIPAYMLSLAGKWFACRVGAIGNALWIEGADEQIRNGMSGSPIVTVEGAIGVVCVSWGDADRGVEGGFEGGPNPYLVEALPVWLLDQLNL